MPNQVIYGLQSIFVFLIYSFSHIRVQVFHKSRRWYMWPIDECSTETSPQLLSDYLWGISSWPSIGHVCYTERNQQGRKNWSQGQLKSGMCRRKQHPKLFHMLLWGANQQRQPPRLNQSLPFFLDAESTYFKMMLFIFCLLTCQLLSAQPRLARAFRCLLKRREKKRWRS